MSIAGKSILVLSVVVTLGISHGYTAWKFYNIGASVTNNKVLTQAVKDRKQNAKTEKKIRSLDNADLVRRYCKWVYDVPYDECIRSVVLVDQKPAN